MKTKYLVLAAAMAGALGAGGYGLYMFGMQRGMGMTTTNTAAVGESPVSAAQVAGKVPQSIAEGEEATRRHISAGIKAGDTDPVAGKQVLYYHDPMVPGNKFDKPAKSPFMDMMLVPVYADSDGDQGKVT
ncbi:MAG: efflux RND transporter periplasmic adaptor subunit, partial [Burkholderiaceae bacterium]